MHEHEQYAVFFDLDGTLHNSSGQIISCFQHAITSLGYTSKTREEIEKTFGSGLMDSYRVLVPEGNIDELCNAHRKFQSEHPELLHTFPNTIPTLEKIKSEKLKTAVITVRMKDSAIEVMNQTGVIKYIDYLIGKEDVQKTKPDAEPINKALNYFNVKPKNAWMVGDTRVDIEAGKAVGTKTIGIKNDRSSNEFTVSRPDHIIDDISEIMPIILLQIGILSSSI